MPTQLSALHLPLVSSRLIVDRTTPGRILGVSILTTGPAKGHGFDVDENLVERVVHLGQGIRGRWTHGAPGASALGRHLGEWSNLRTQRFSVCRSCQLEAETPHCGQCGAKTEAALRALGDFAFSASAWKLKPDGLDVPAPEYLMTRAEEDPRSLGISIVAPLRLEAEPGNSDTPRTLARIVGDELLRADWVADPAANPTGLSQDAGEEPFLPHLDRLVATRGEEGARLHMLGVLARYFGDEAEEPAAAPPPVLSPSAEDVAALRNELASLRAEVEGVRRETRSLSVGLAAERIRFLKRQAAALDAPVTADEIASLEALADQGNYAAVRTRAEACLARCEAKQQAPHEAVAVVPLRVQPTAEDSLAVQARVFDASRRVLPPLPSLSPTPTAQGGRHESS